ncbi:hypothetical protein HMPREF9080_02422 [Cardiobacterium valvarum F0432]|uniref:Uncharacterized protein n=1 Tax=Cardiobacterium valvarum F0432 TaxID=797473 RepID=G9ZI14_9GAMM|nr:hypothetical protein HMPREF9080_02422 [Cardiobacterium valvarum F0432]
MGKRCVHGATTCASSDGQTIASFGTTAAQDFATVFGSHTGTETVRTLAGNIARLERSF